MEPTIDEGALDFSIGQKYRWGMASSWMYNHFYNIVYGCVIIRNKFNEKRIWMMLHCNGSGDW